jgi:hypothetical protein
MNNVINNGEYEASRGKRSVVKVAKAAQPAVTQLAQPLAHERLLHRIKHGLVRRSSVLEMNAVPVLQ